MTASDASAGSTKSPAEAARKVVGEAFTAAWAGCIAQGYPEMAQGGLGVFSA